MKFKTFFSFSMLDKEKKPYLSTSAAIEYHGKSKTEPNPNGLLQLILNRAAINGDIEMFDYMRSNGADKLSELKLQEALNLAIENSQEVSALLIINWGGSDVTSHIDKVSHETFLHKAAFKGLPRVCGALLETNPSISIDAKTKDKSTALHFAVASGSLETVEFLINKGASTKIKNSHKNTAKALAIMYNYQEIIKCLEVGKRSNFSTDPSSNMDPLAPQSSSRISRID
jgi:ankyrin repeat protein